MEPVRLLAVEDSATLAEALLFAFGFEEGIEAIGVAPTISRALEMVANERPDVVLMDVRLPDGSGVEAVSRVMALRPGTAVIVMTAHANSRMALEVANAGAAGFLLKDVRIGKIVAAVRRAVTEGLAVDPAVLESILAEAKAEGLALPPSRETDVELTHSEREVVRLLAEGLDRQAIAAALGVEEHEVATITAAVREHIDARSNLEAVVRAARVGFFGPDQDSRARISNR